jgi:hypothetical protein
MSGNAWTGALPAAVRTPPPPPPPAAKEVDAAPTLKVLTRSFARVRQQGESGEHCDEGEKAYTQWFGE